MLSGNLPDDVMTEILGRLPVESLLRFKGVRKSWYALVKDPSFITKHHKARVAISNNGCVLLRRLRNRPKYAFSLVYNHNNSEACVDLNLPFLKDAKTKHIRFVASCNGVFCVTYCAGENYDIVLWNPAIRGEFKALPKCNGPHPLPPNTRKEGSSIGFGIDPKTNDYKVVRIWTLNESGRCKSIKDCKDGKITSKVEVCTVVVSGRGNSCWREIDAPPVPISPYFYHVYLKAKGCYYWPSHFSPPKSIVSFDMVDEVFQEIQLPDARIVRAAEAIDYWGSILVLNDSIALCSFPLERNENCFEVWQMNDFGGEQVSWSKYMTVETSLPKMVPLQFWINGELLLQDSCNGKLHSYSPVTGETKDLLGIEVDNLQQVLIYNESLVSIKGKGNEINKFM